MKTEDPFITRLQEHLKEVEALDPTPGLDSRVHAHVLQANQEPQKSFLPSLLARTPKTGTSLTPKRRFQPARLALGGAGVIPAILIVVFVVSLAGGHTVNNTFSNIASGLNVGGSGSYSQSTQSSVGPSAAAPSSSSSNNAGRLSKSALSTSTNTVTSPGNLPPNEERLVSIGYLIPQGSFQHAFNILTSNAVNLGGYLQSTQTYQNSAHRVDSGSIVLKVPTTNLTQFLNKVPTSFVTSYINFNFKDFSQSVATTQNTIQQDQAQLAIFQQELANTSDPATQATLQQQILSLEATITDAQQSVSTTAATVADTTLTISLQEKGVIMQAPTQLQQAVTHGIHNDLVVLGVFLVIVLTLLPFLVIVCLIWLAVRPQIRKRKNHSDPPFPTVE